MKPHDRSSLLRRIILPLLLVFTLTTAHADEKSAKLIRTLSDKIASGKAYEILFTASMENEFSDVAGRIVVSGDRYYVHVNDYELFCDGKLLYTYNSNEDEVTIEKPDPNDHSLLSNPSRFFKMDEQDFDNAYKGSVAVGGRTAERVELTPKVKGAGYRSIRLLLDPQSGLPRRYRLRHGRRGYRRNQNQQDHARHRCRARSIHIRQKEIQGCRNNRLQIIYPAGSRYSNCHRSSSATCCGKLSAAAP